MKTASAVVAFRWACGFAVLSISSSTVLAQASWRWQGSTDGGATWTSGMIAVPREQATLLVRGVWEWDRSATQGFAFREMSLMDVTVTGTDGSGAGDTTGDFHYHPVLGGVAPLNEQRFGNVIKIDRSSDTLPPGAGPNGLWSFQTNVLGEIRVFDNPLVFFTFRLDLDGSLGERRVSELFRAYMDPMNSTDRVLRLFVTEGNAVEFPVVSRQALSINVVPIPSSCLPPAFGAALLTCRRRRVR